MPKANLNGVTLTESDLTEVVEGNHYFPPGSVNLHLFRESEPIDVAKNINGQVAFYGDKARVEG